MAQVMAAYDDAMLLADRDVVRLIAASVLANQLDGPPVWLMVVASSSGGKSAILMTLDELELMPGKRMTFFISDLTENTLASGFKSSQGEASLLMQLPLGGILIFKDFTSLLTKRRESRDAIMGQLREVYDRKFDKRTGNSANVTWKGKAGALAGVTQAVHEYMSEMSIMGDRFVMYSMIQPNRRKATDFVMKMKMDDVSQEKRMLVAKGVMHEYLRDALKGMGDAKLVMKSEDQNKLIDVADFVTLVRSGVVEDERRGFIKFVPSPEMPIRLIDQLLSLGTALSHMREREGLNPELEENDMNLLYKIAFDSIPIKRRWALQKLATYAQGVTTAGVATVLGYETEVVKGWLAQLNALGVARRIKSSGAGDQWVLNEEFKELMYTFEHIQEIDDRLVSPEQASGDEALRREALGNVDPLASEFDDEDLP